MTYNESIIIRNATDMPMLECLNYIGSVIKLGRVSDDEKSYCFVTSFANGVYVSARRQKCSDVFNIWKEDHGNEN